MTIALQTRREDTQLVENVESLFAAITQYYMVPFSQRSEHSGLTIQFGRHRIMENILSFNPFKPEATLFIREIDDQLVKTLTGKTAVALGQEEVALREKEGNRAANAFPSTFQSRIDDFFGHTGVMMKINTYQSTKVSLTININTLDNATLNTVSTVLQHCGMAPKAPSTRAYTL